VGQYQRTARPLGYRCYATEVPDAIERLLRNYLENRRSAEENLRAYFSRHSDEELRTELAGIPLIPVERDPSPGRVPHAVGE
jgi:sulfite reductase (ferredoxin)